MIQSQHNTSAHAAHQDAELESQVRGNTLLAKIRRRQLETAQAGRIRESMYYARLANRVRRVLCNWASDPNSMNMA